MKFYHIEKRRNLECSQCGKSVRRVSIRLRSQSPCINMVKILEKNGFELDPDYEPVLTLLDFNDIKVLDLEKNPIENGLRNYESITAAGFKDGEIFVTLKLK